jgi:hypothetical protein
MASRVVAGVAPGPLRGRRTGGGEVGEAPEALGDGTVVVSLDREEALGQIAQGARPLRRPGCVVRSLDQDVRARAAPRDGDDGRAPGAVDAV